MPLSKNYYDDVGILYSYTADFGSGYCVKRWNVDFDPTIDQPIFDGPPSARWQYLDKDFKKDLSVIKKKREIWEYIKRGNSYNSPVVKRTLVADDSILAKFALLENELSYKTQVFIQLEKLKDKINEGDIDLEKTVEVLQSLL